MILLKIDEIKKKKIESEGLPTFQAYKTERRHKDFPAFSNRNIIKITQSQIGKCKQRYGGYETLGN